MKINWIIYLVSFVLESKLLLFRYYPIIGLTFVPPSITYSEPVIKPASSEDRKVTSLATSSAFPNRFKGILFNVADPKLSTVAASRPTVLNKFVAIGPGQTAFILIPNGDNSVDATFTSEFRAALLAEYTEQLD